MKKKKCDIYDHLCDDEKTSKINWFPGHMNKAVKKIKERLKMVDIVLEIRDARSPLVTGNKSVNYQLREKSRLIVINKTDLADPEIVKLWKEWFTKQGEPFVFINSFNKNSIKTVIQLSKKVVNDKILKSNPSHAAKTKLKMMIIGLPNTGKSTIINKLANRNATKVANKPGQTQQQLWVKVNKDLDLLDTPGVMPPQIEKYEHGLWLAALHAIPDRIVEPETSACYIIEHLLKIKSTIFKDKYKLDNLECDLIGILDQIAKNRGYLLKKNIYNYDQVYKVVLNDFRSGDLGLISFGMPPK
jgi:ribosome biogenesis GTPase A